MKIFTCENHRCGRRIKIESCFHNIPECPYCGCKFLIIEEYPDPPAYEEPPKKKKKR